MILHSEGSSNLKQFLMNNASILQTKHHSSNKTLTTLDHAWTAASAGDVAEMVKALRQRIERENITTTMASRLHCEHEDQTLGDHLNWKTIKNVLMQEQPSVNDIAFRQRIMRTAVDALLN